VPFFFGQILTLLPLHIFYTIHQFSQLAERVDPTQIVADAKNTLNDFTKKDKNNDKKRTPSSIVSEYNAARVKYFIKQANLRHDVKRFREEILLSQLLTTEQAYEFISSSIIRNTNYYEFLEYKESVTTYPFIKEEIVSQSEEDELGGVSRPGNWRTWEIDISTLLSRQKYSRKDFIDSDETKFLAFPSPTGQVKVIFVSQGSVGDVLRKIAISLATQYRWEVAEATWFVLTGKVPWTKSVTVSHEVSDHTDHGFLTVVIKADLWTPAEYVEKVFGTYQHLLLGGNNQPIDRRTLRMFELVEEVTDYCGGRPDWDSLKELWNKKFSSEEEKPYPYPSYLERAYYSTRKKLLFPQYVYGDEDPDIEENSLSKESLKDLPSTSAKRKSSKKSKTQENDL
jgi:hypothetical protein